MAPTTENLPSCCQFRTDRKDARSRVRRRGSVPAGPSTRGEGSRSPRRAEPAERPAVAPVEVDVLEQDERGADRDLVPAHVGGVQHEKALLLVAAEDDDADDLFAGRVENDVNAAAEPDSLEHHREPQELLCRSRPHASLLPRGGRSYSKVTENRRRHLGDPGR